MNVTYALNENDTLRNLNVNLGETNCRLLFLTILACEFSGAGTVLFVGTMPSPVGPDP